MTIELKIGQLNTSNASDGDLLSYVGANGIVEYRDVVSEIDARIVANVNSVQDNVTAVDNNAWVNANDYSTYTTVTALIDTVQANLTSVIDAAPSTLDTLAEIAAALENDANIAVTLTNQIGTVSANAATNATNIDLVQDNVDVVGASLDSFGLYANSTFALSNEAVTFADLEVANLVVEGDMTIIGDTTTIESNNVVITNPYLLLNNGISGANTLDSGIVIDRGSSANVGLIWDEDSDSFTFITTDDGVEQTELTPTGNASVVVGGLKINSTTIDLETNSPVDGQPLVYVAANDAFETGTAAASNTQIYVGDTLVSNTAVILEAGNGVSLSSNADSGIVTFTTAMGNVTSQVISVDGTANAFTMSKASANSNMLLVFYNGLALDHEEYSVSGTTLTLSNVDPLIADSKLQVRHFDFFDVTGVVEGGGAVSYSFQGSSFGYVSGGLAPALVDKIERYSFTSDANGADVGELSYTSAAGIGLVSSTAGYDAGGQSAPNVFRDTINKFDFSSSMSGSNIATMTTRRRLGGGASSESYGYALGGHYSNPVYNESFEKISFTSNTNGLDVAEISQAKTNLSGHSSETHGYISGGYYLSPTLTTVKVSAIEKTPFSSETSTSSVGSLTIAKNSGQGYSSDSFGYFSGGNSPVLTTIEYFPFASDTNATDGGADLAVAVNYGASSSSTTSGYNSGGLGGSAQNTIQKFPFSSNDNASDIADLSAAGYFFTGTQN